MEKLNFCTLFNANYLSRGMVMYESLLKNCENFHLYVLAFDDETFAYINGLQAENLTAISLPEFEDEDLKRVKKERTAAEYCWTCSAASIHYCMTHYQLENCTYIDADMLFYANPRLILDEMKQDSVIITSHRYTATYDQSKISGTYCVQFVTFKNDERGMQVLNWWRERCIEWCYARVEDGKFGDQKYLDEFQTRFSGVHEAQQLGCGVAPWNVQQYTFAFENGQFTGTETASGATFPLVFFHFHGLKFFEDDIVQFTGSLYSLTPEVQDQFFKPYVRLLNAKADEIRATHPQLNANGVGGKSPYKPMNPLLKVHFFLSEVKNSPAGKVASKFGQRVTNHYFHYSRKL